MDNNYFQRWILVFRSDFSAHSINLVATTERLLVRLLFRSKEVQLQDFSSSFAF